MGELLVGVTIFIGIAIMFRVVSIKKGSNLVFWVIAIFIAGPVVYGIVKFNVMSFFSQGHPWWVYPIIVLAVLIVIRLMLDWLFGRRRE